MEVAVQIVQRWVLARLRHRKFFSLAELNAAIRALIADLNDRPMRNLGVRRRALFESVERPALNGTGQLSVAIVHRGAARPREPAQADASRCS